MSLHENEISHKVIGAAMAVHTELGHGLLENAYEECLYYELTTMGLFVERQKPLPLIYKQVKLDAGYRCDLLVEKKVIIEIKAIEAFSDVHTAPVITYLRLSDCKLGLLLNFNIKSMKEGIRRLVYRL